MCVYSFVFLEVDLFPLTSWSLEVGQEANACIIICVYNYAKLLLFFFILMVMHEGQTCENIFLIVLPQGNLVKLLNSCLSITLLSFWILANVLGKKCTPANFFSVQFSHSVVSDSLWPHGLQHARPSCPSPTPWVYSNSCPLSWWCHPTVSSSVIPFSSRLQSFPVSGSFQMSQFFEWP